MGTRGEALGRRRIGMRQEDLRMKIAAFATALLLGSAAFAQIDATAGTAYEGDGADTTIWETERRAPGAYVSLDPAVAGAASAAIVLPSNGAPERDARGIAVISDPAVAPAGWNGLAATAMGGPELDPATGEPAAARTYPACTATVTDNCLQTYEKGRR
jgi:hypothetical protein